MEDLHKSQVQAYKDAARKALQEWSQSIPLQPMEETDTEETFVQRCVSVPMMGNDPNPIPRWTGLDDWEAAAMTMLRHRAKVTFAKYHPDKDDIDQINDSTTTDKEQEVVDTASNSKTNENKKVPVDDGREAPTGVVEEKNDENHDDDDGEIDEGEEAEEDGQEVGDEMGVIGEDNSGATIGDDGQNASESTAGPKKLTAMTNATKKGTQQQQQQQRKPRPQKGKATLRKQAVASIKAGSAANSNNGNLNNRGGQGMRKGGGGGTAARGRGRRPNTNNSKN